MEPRTIITDLEKLSKRAGEINPEESKQEIKDIILELKLLIKEQNLRGLSAPQIGEGYRVVAIQYPKEVKAYVDPQILKCKGVAPVIETDPSLPGKRYLLPRYFHIDMRALTANGVVETFPLEGQAAYVMQQMVDHLEGVLISDYGLEITEVFDEMSDEDKEQLIQEYMMSLQDAEVEINKQVDEDDTLREIRKGMTFLDSVRKGETIIEYEQHTVSEEELEEGQRGTEDEDDDSPEGEPDDE